MNKTIQIPEWAIGSDKLVKIKMPLPSTAYEVVRVSVVDLKTRQIEGLYATSEKAEHITEGVTMVDEEGVAWISIQLASKHTINYRQGIKYMEITPVVIAPEWVDGKKNLPEREFFAAYYKLETAI